MNQGNIPQSDTQTLVFMHLAIQQSAVTQSIEIY